MVKDFPAGRAGESEEFAQVCFAVLNSTYLNGVTIRIDGGQRVPKL
jgi:NAD(P)-dependent dehydrogenase (short-subunit alcohol dehydrogenase family)